MLILSKNVVGYISGMSNAVLLLNHTCSMTLEMAELAS